MLMITEWIEAEMRTPEGDLEKKYPYLMMKHEDEGVYGLRWIAIRVGHLMDTAFNRMTSSQAESLIHETFGGNYDFDVVPFFFKKWMQIMDTHLALDTTGEVSVDQMYNLMIDQIEGENNGKSK